MLSCAVCAGLRPDHCRLTIWLSICCSCSFNDRLEGVIKENWCCAEAGPPGRTELPRDAPFCGCLLLVELILLITFKYVPGAFVEPPTREVPAAAVAPTVGLAPALLPFFSRSTEDTDEEPGRGRGGGGTDEEPLRLPACPFRPKSDPRRGAEPAPGVGVFVIASLAVMTEAALTLWLPPLELAPVLAAVRFLM